MNKDDMMCVCVCVCVCVYTHIPIMEYYSFIKDEIMPITGTWLDLDIIILSGVSQKEKDKYYMIALIM